jgi:PAS domain S-box-containing protein
MIIGLTVAVFFGARFLQERDERRESLRRINVVQRNFGERMALAASLTESLRRFMVSGGNTPLTSRAFKDNASRWLRPPGFPAAAWVERVPASGRAEYERRAGHPIVDRDRHGGIAHAGARTSYAPASLVSGAAPAAVAGMDLLDEAGRGSALERASSSGDVQATPLLTVRDGGEGLFLVRSAPRVTDGAVRPGFVVLFFPNRYRTAAADTGVTLSNSTGEPAAAGTVSRTVVAGGQRFRLAQPRGWVSRAGETLPWLLLGAGLVLAVVAAALGVIAQRRAKAQEELDRIFNLSPDLIAIADFDGNFTRVNPAVEEVLGYKQEEILARPYLDLVHPADRESTAAEAAAIGEGKKTLYFENRYVHKDGSHRVLEWTSAPVVADRAMYGVARDVTERRRAEAEVERLADEQAALRRVATLVAEDVPSPELFEAVAREVGTLLGGDFAGIARFEKDHVITVGVWAAEGEHPPVPPRWQMQPGDPATTIAETREATRWTDWTDVPGPIAEFIRGLGIRSTVGTPIVVAGRLWGALALHSKQGVPLPTDTESRMAQFTDLVGTAVANREARAEVTRLADEQAALRRVATVIAAEASQAAVFGAIARECGQLFGTEDIAMARYEGDRSQVIVASSGKFADAWPVGSRQPLGGDNAGSRVFRTRRPVRIDDYANATGPIGETGRSIGIRSVVATPIMGTEGRLWGTLTIGTSQDEPLPPDTEARLGQFTELMSTGIARTESRAEVERLAEEQAALRRVATLVARQAPQAEVFTSVAEESARLLGTEVSRMMRYEDDDSAVVVAVWGEAEDVFPIGSRIRLEGESVAARVLRTRQPARIDDYSETTGQIAELVRSIGIRSAVAAPIQVEGRLWGVLTTATSRDEPLPPETESRLSQFTELMATAIANTESHARAEGLATEQAALRRVATLVAAGGTPGEIFAAVGDEVRQLVGNDLTSMFRCELGDMLTLVAVRARAEPVPPGLVGARIPMRAQFAEWLKTGHPVHLDAHATAKWMVDLPASERLRLKSAIGAPIIVGGRPWGAIFVCDRKVDGLAAEAERPFAQFTELVATAIANAEARAEVERLAEEQAALRRVATLVAEGAAPAAVFDAVAAEMEGVLGADGVTLSRYEPEEEVTVLAHQGANAARVPPGTRVRHSGENVTSIVRRTKRPARLEHYEGTHGPIAELVRDLGVRASVGAPIIVDGQLWGCTIANWQSELSPPPETEERMAQFAALLDTAIANVDSRDQLTASRARLVTAGDEARRRVVRDLHDGAQQRLVHTIVTLKLAQRALREENGKAESVVGEALQHAQRANVELRELAHGIHPSVLTRGGLRAGVDAVVTRLDLPVEVDLPSERFAPEIEASAYFIVAEALTNVVKHAHADRAEVRAFVEDGMLHLEVRDDGVGGADSGGHGLVGLEDRATALGGQLKIESPAGGGTLVAATLPLSAG